MIDEVDAGAASVLKSVLNGEDQQANLLGGLFGIVKNQLLGATVARGFAVGITTLTVKENLTLSVWQDLTSDGRLEGLCGFTQSDIDDILARLPADDKLFALKTYLKDTQNGYHFLPPCGSHLEAPGMTFYNTSIVLFIVGRYLQKMEFDDYAAHDLLPEKLLVLFRTGRHQIMMELLHELAGNPINLPCSPHPFEYIESIDALENRDGCVRLLLSAGFLTFQTADLLKVPNKLAHHAISRIVMEWIYEPNELHELHQVVLQFFTGNPDPLVKFIESTDYQALSTRDSQGASEHSFKTLLLPRFTWTDRYIIHSENAVKGGFIDLFLQRTLQGRAAGKSYRDEILELKYVQLKQLKGQSHATLEDMDPSALRALCVEWRNQKREAGNTTLGSNKKRKQLPSLQKEKEKEKEKEKKKEKGKGKGKGGRTGKRQTRSRGKKKDTEEDDDDDYEQSEQEEEEESEEDEVTARTKGGQHKGKRSVPDTLTRPVRRSIRTRPAPAQKVSRPPSTQSDNEKESETEKEKKKTKKKEKQDYGVGKKKHEEVTPSRKSNTKKKEQKKENQDDEGKKREQKEATPSESSTAIPNKITLAEVECLACLQALKYAERKKKEIEALSGLSRPLIVTLVSLGWSRILFRTWEMEEAERMAKDRETHK